MSEQKNPQPEAVVKVKLPEPAAQLYWARLTRLVQLREDIDSNLQNISSNGTFNFYRGTFDDLELHSGGLASVNIRKTDVKPFQFAPGLRQGVLRGIYGSWRQLTDLGYGDLANTIVKYDRDRQGIHPDKSFKPVGKSRK